VRPLGAVEAPDYIEPVIGWRAWRATLSTEGAELISAFHDHRWPQYRQVSAVCRAFQLPWRSRHAAPEERCGCGIYAVGFEPFARGYASLGPPGLYFPVLGTVALWGKVVVTWYGWRAEFAYPQQLLVPILGRRRHVAHRLAAGLARYGVPVHVLETPGEALEKDASELRRLVQDAG
jgi:hypothetical protein